MKTTERQVRRQPLDAPPLPSMWAAHVQHATGPMRLAIGRRFNPAATAHRPDKLHSSGSSCRPQLRPQTASPSLAALAGHELVVTERWEKIVHLVLFGAFVALLAADFYL